MSNINEIPQGSWWHSYTNLNTKNFFTKILWPWPQGHPRGWDGANKNFRPISIIMPNMNEIHQRVFKLWGLINFNTKTSTLWWKDERTNERTYKQTDERTSDNYFPSHTSYVGGIKNLSVILSECQTVWIQITFCRAWSGSKLFAKVISRWQTSTLAGKALTYLYSNCSKILYTKVSDTMHKQKQSNQGLHCLPFHKTF